MEFFFALYKFINQSINNYLNKTKNCITDATCPFKGALLAQVREL
jgi:hypothetical protein